MTKMRTATLLLAAILAVPVQGTTAQQPASSGTLDEAAPPGANYDKAEFRLWIPPAAATVRAIVVLVPGSNGDGRPMADDAFWQRLRDAVTRSHSSPAGSPTSRTTSRSSSTTSTSRGAAGRRCSTRIAAFAERAKHPELARAPFFMWGMSAGGQFNYEFVAWKPERVAAFVVNKGGIYYTALVSKAAREVPGMLFIGEKDLSSAIDTIDGLFAVNRRAGALWALTQEPGRRARRRPFARSWRDALRGRAAAAGARDDRDQRPGHAQADRSEIRLHRRSQGDDDEADCRSRHAFGSDRLVAHRASRARLGRRHDRRTVRVIAGSPI